jgi:hypothetical protein
MRPIRARSRSPSIGRSAGAANVSVAVEPGERTALADASVQLVAVAQALHWFDRDAFFAGMRARARPGGLLAAWGYGDFIAPEGWSRPWKISAP